MYSCEKKNTGDSIKANLSISYVNENGDDLLNKNTPNYIDSANIDIYYLIDGERVRFYDARMDLPESFQIYYDKNVDKYFLDLHLSYFMEDSISVTYIQNKEDIDTVKSKFRIFEGGYGYEKIWYNDVLMLDNSSDAIEVIKK